MKRDQDVVVILTGDQAVRLIAGAKLAARHMQHELAEKLATLPEAVKLRIQEEIDGIEEGADRLFMQLKLASAAASSTAEAR